MRPVAMARVGARLPRRVAMRIAPLQPMAGAIRNGDAPLDLGLKHFRQVRPVRPKNLKALAVVRSPGAEQIEGDVFGYVQNGGIAIDRSFETVETLLRALPGPSRYRHS